MVSEHSKELLIFLYIYIFGSEYISRCTAKKNPSHIFFKAAIVLCHMCDDVCADLPLPLKQPSPQVGNLYMCIHTGHTLTAVLVHTQTSQPTEAHSCQCVK